MIFLILWILISILVFGEKPPINENRAINEGFYKAPSQVIYSYYPKYQNIIDCLIKYESSGNPLAVGDSGKAIGILQFHEPTFQRYCVDKYGYYDDIWDAEIAKNCVAEMLEENINNIDHWSVKNLCQ